MRRHTLPEKQPGLNDTMQHRTQLRLRFAHHRGQQGMRKLATHRFGLSTLRKRSAPPASLARKPEKRKNPHWFGGSYGESRIRPPDRFSATVKQDRNNEVAMAANLPHQVSSMSISAPEAPLVQVAAALAPMISAEVEIRRREIAVTWLRNLHEVMKAWNDDFIKLLKTYPGFKDSTNPTDYQIFFAKLEKMRSYMLERDISVKERLCEPIWRLHNRFPRDFAWLAAKDEALYREMSRLIDYAYRGEGQVINMADGFIDAVCGRDIPDIRDAEDFFQAQIKKRATICQRIIEYQKKSEKSVSDLKQISKDADIALVPVDESPPHKGYLDPMTISKQLSGTPQIEHKFLYTILAFCFGVAFLIAILVIAIFIPEPKPFQVRTFTTVMAIAAAGAATVMTGLINTKITLGKQLAIGATGALAVFVIVYLVNPAVLH
jgi:hypothetical protein